jgi:hypothetical protein
MSTHTPGPVVKAVLLGAVVATLGTTVALAQSSTHVKTPIEAFTGTGSTPIPPGWQEIKATPVTIVPVRPEAVVIRFGDGGLISEHQRRYAGYRLISAPVELRGPCYSACTIVLSYVSKENLCIGAGAFMAFHAARTGMDGPIDGGATIRMYDAYPHDIQAWIDRNGGVGKLPRDGYWTMYDRELWAIGYPQCK